MSEPLPFHVAKFGGTSVGTPERVQRVVDLVVQTAPDHRRVVVSSAFGGVTDRLLDAIEAAKARTGEHVPILAEIRQRHADALAVLAPDGERADLHAEHDALFEAVRELLDGVYLLRVCDLRFQDAIISAGERASVPLLAAAFRAQGHEAIALDARAFVRTDDDFGEATVDFATTDALIQDRFASIPDGTLAIVTGFVATTPEGVTTTLGRSGSDYTATILAGALDAAECIIWTDVDGVLSADPRIVPDAFSLPRLSYEEAAELAYFGAKVLHPRTMRPLQRKGIPLVIKNTMNPEAAGTTIGPEAVRTDGRIKAVTSVRGAALVRVQGAGVLGVPDLTARAFAVLADARIDVHLIAQASSEGSLCFSVKASAAEDAVRLLNREFQRECERGDLYGIDAETGAAVVAAVGDSMRDAPGLAGKMFATLARAHVNVRAIAQGASEHNISAVVADSDAPQAMRALHETFSLRRTRAHVFLIGAGGLGQRLLTVLDRQASILRDTHGLNLCLVGLADSQRMVFDETGLSPQDGLQRLADAEPADLDAVLARLTSARLERLIVVDVTPSPNVAARHAELLRAGIAVVTPNKAATVVDAALWQAARQASQDGEAPYLFETTVGAGLGVVAMLRDLRRTGDTIHRIEGLLSGTLAFLFNAMRDGATFSEAVGLARARGYTEPDPRDDLSGRDVARKLTVLARELGLATNPADAAIESLVPEPLRGVSTAEFLDRLPDFDPSWAERLEQGEHQYVARLLADGTIQAGVDRVEPGSPLSGLQDASLVVAFHTERYAPQPLVIQGPGASADVTAAVLLADIARAAEAMR